MQQTDLTIDDIREELGEMHLLIIQLKKRIRQLSAENETLKKGIDVDD